MICHRILSSYRWALLLTALLFAPAFAQISTGDITGRVRIKAYADFYNLFNRENISLANRFGSSPVTAPRGFMQPVSLFGPGFGPPVGRPFTMQLGVRLDF